MTNLNSILVYLLCFTGSIFFCYIAERKHNRNPRSISFIIFSAFAILIPCLVAMLRNSTVGGDVEFYCVPNFEKSRSYSHFIEYSHNTFPEVEILYALLLFIGGKINSLHFVFFVNELLIILPLYIAIFKYRTPVNNKTLGYALYLLLFYNIGLSALRQSIAMSFVLLLFVECQQKRYKTAIILGIIAFLFHKSSLLIMFLIIIYGYLKNKIAIYKFINIQNAILIIIFLLYGKITNLIAKILWNLSPRYSYYILHYNSGINWENIPITDLLTKTTIVSISMLILIYTKKLNNGMFIPACYSILGRFFVLLNARFYESLRIAYYFDVFLILLAVESFAAVKKDRYNKTILSISYIGLGLLYWAYFIMYIGGYQTSIYTLGA